MRPKKCDCCGSSDVDVRPFQEYAADCIDCGARGSLSPDNEWHWTPSRVARRIERLESDAGTNGIEVTR